MFFLTMKTRRCAKKTLTHTVTIIHQIYRETVEKLALEISSRQVIFDKKEMVKSSAHTFL